MVVGGVILLVGMFGGVLIVGGVMVVVGIGWIVGELVDYFNMLVDYGCLWLFINFEVFNDWLVIVILVVGEYSLVGKGVFVLLEVVVVLKMFMFMCLVLDLVVGGGGIVMMGVQVKDLLMYGDWMLGEQKVELIMFLGFGLGQVGVMCMFECVGLL